MQLNPKSVQIAGVATATIVAFGLAVASATKVEPAAQPVTARVSPGPAAIEEAEDVATPEPTATPSPDPSPVADSTDNDDSDSDDSDSDDSDSADDRDDDDSDARADWVRSWQKAAEKRRQHAEHQRKEHRKQLEKLAKERDHGDREGQNYDWSRRWGSD